MIYTVLAQEPAKGEGLTISPPIKELSIEPGENIKQTIKLTNPTENLVKVYPKIMDFNAKGEGGEPGFHVATDDSAKFSLAKWITYRQPAVALTAKQVVEFNYEINVPQDAEAGGHYGAVFFTTEPPENDPTKGSQVALNSMVGSLVLVRVPGDIKENGQLESFSVNKFFNFKNSIKFTTRVANSGNVHFKPLGSINIESLFGKKVDTVTVNEGKGNVLPESVRKFENEWKSGKILVGFYKAKLALVYGESNKSIIAEKTFLIMPWWAIIIIVVVLLLLLILIWLLIRKIRKRKRIKRRNRPNDGGKIILR